MRAGYEPCTSEQQALFEDHSQHTCTRSADGADLEVAARDGPSRKTVAAAVTRVVLDFTWAVHHQRLGGEGQVRSVRERRCCKAKLLGGNFGTIVPGD